MAVGVQHASSGMHQYSLGGRYKFSNVLPPCPGSAGSSKALVPTPKFTQCLSQEDNSPPNLGHKGGTFHNFQAWFRRYSAYI
jgi:hypothetical protein